MRENKKSMRYVSIVQVGIGGCERWVGGREGGGNFW